MTNPQSSKKQNGIRNAANRVVVVAAKSALDEYSKYSAYICLPHRFFQESVRMAFYTNNTIDRYIPKILGKAEAISYHEIETRTDITDRDKARLRTLFIKLTQERKEQWGKNQFKVIFLSEPTSSDPDTLVLPHDIVNDSKDKNGRPTAFTQNQRYVSLSRLEKEPKSTSELV